MMKKRTILISLLLSVCISCGMPTIYDVRNNEQYSDLRCLSPKKKMLISRVYNTCPVFSTKPEPKSMYWDILVLNDISFLNYKNGLKFRDKILSDTQNCKLPTLLSLQYILDSDEKLFVERIVERADTVSSNRLFLYGTWYKSGLASKESWTIDIEDNIHLTTRERVFSLFEVCK